MSFMFENLGVYQKAVDFANKIMALTEQSPRGYYSLTHQLNRAALSIATNIAEGNGPFTKADRRNFSTIARGSVHKCVPLLELGKRRAFISERVCIQMRNELQTVAKMLSGLISGLDKRKK